MPDLVQAMVREQYFQINSGLMAGRRMMSICEAAHVRSAELAQDNETHLQVSFVLFVLSNTG